MRQSSARRTVLGDRPCGFLGKARRLLKLSIFTFLCAVSFASYAAGINWINAAGGPFNVAGNWSLGPPPGPPGLFDIPIFEIGGETYTVDIAPGITNSRAIIRTDAVTFDLGTNTYTLDSVAASRSLAIANAGGNVGSLTLTNGTMNVTDAVAGNNATGSGTLNVSTGATLNMSDHLFVADAGAGFFNVQNGGAVDMNGNDAVIGNPSGSNGCDGE